MQASAIEASDNSEESVIQEEHFKFAADVVEKYYRNKDLGEHNDFAKDVSE
ncbi:hypothetical protein D3C81_2240660 [compost metagenome]